MDRIVFTLPPWAPGFNSEFTRQTINAAARVFAAWYQSHPLPPLYQSGVRFAKEPNHGQGWEEYADPWTTFARQWGDCDDLNLYRLTELYAAGESNAGTRAIWRGPHIHVIVRRADGTLEDPSDMLGAPRG